MELQSYFEPISRASVDFLEGDFDVCLGSAVDTYWEEGAFPNLQNVTLAIVGVCEDRGAIRNNGCGAAPDTIRRKLYRLATPADNMAVVDLGNIAPGCTPEDTQYAVTEVLYQLMDRNIAVIILGGGQDLTLAQYKAYEILGRVINITAIDSRFDLAETERVDSHSYLYHIIRQDPNYLFNYTNIGYQTYFNERKLIGLIDDLKFDAFRLGEAQGDMTRAETLIRAADMVTVDMSSVRQSDCPANGNPSPHGFYGEELCQLARFAGMSDKLTSFGVYELNPRYDHNYQSAHLVAHALWYFIEGYYNRYFDFPYRDKENYKRFLVTLNRNDFLMSPVRSGSSQAEETSNFEDADIHNMEIVFVKSKKSDRWWMEVPCDLDERRERYMRHLLVPCTYQEYEQAMKNEIPDLWMRYYFRVNS